MAKHVLKNPFVRSPTLDTVLMVEKNIEKYSGELSNVANILGYFGIS